MLGLHGHIHESRGIRQIGSTTVVNPGSEYAEGILDGVIVELEPGKGIVDLRMVSG
jgi:Icc-related predicted phosphoesterase